MPITLKTLGASQKLQAPGDLQISQETPLFLLPPPNLRQFCRTTPRPPANIRQQEATCTSGRLLSPARGPQSQGRAPSSPSAHLAALPSSLPHSLFPQAIRKSVTSRKVLAEATTSGTDSRAVPSPFQRPAAAPPRRLAALQRTS